MKKITYYLFIFTLLAAPVFTSCEDEPLEGEFSSTPDGSEDGGTDIIVDQEACDIAQAALIGSQALFASSTEENYAQNCENYATTIEAYIPICGDADGSLNATLLALGDCSTVNACLQAQANVAVAQNAFNNATDENMESACLNYLEALEGLIAACGDTTGSIQAVIDSLPCDNDCDNAIEAVAEAQSVFDAVDPTNGTAYTNACMAYVAALEAQIAACGDEDGTLLEEIQNQGDCSPPEQPGPLQMFVDGEFKNFNSSVVTISGTTLRITSTDEDTGDTFFFRVVFQQAGTNVMQESELRINGALFTPVVTGENAYTNEVTENSSDTDANTGRVVGTFAGEFMNGAGDSIILSEGTFDILYNL